MKAKRILSLLLSVAMIATIISALGVTAFAAPAGYESYVYTNRNAIDDTQAIAEGAVRADISKARVDVSLTPISDAEIKATYDATLEDLGVDSKWSGKGYVLQASMHDLGTYVRTETKVMGKTQVSGFLISATGLKIKISDSSKVYFWGVVSSDVSDEMSAGIDTSVNMLTIAKMAANIPATPGTYADYAIDNYATALMFIEPGVTVECDNAYIMASNMVKNLYYQEGTSEGYKQEDTGLWHPAGNLLATTPSITEYDVTFAWNGGSSTQKVEEGTAATAPADPAAYEEGGYRYTFKEWDADFSNITAATTINAVYTKTAIIGGGEVAEGDKDGTAIIGSDKKYDNSFAVSTSFTKPADLVITKVGVLFIPAAVLGSNDLTAETATAVAAEKDDAFLGAGTISIKAAIRAIPRGLQGRNIEMVTRPFFVVGGEYTYGTAKTTTLNFDFTGEVE